MQKTPSDFNEGDWIHLPSGSRVLITGTVAPDPGFDTVYVPTELGIVGMAMNEYFDVELG